MNHNQPVTTMINTVSVRGFVRNNLKICFEAEKAVEIAREKCREIREKCCSEAGIRFSGKGTSGYFIPKYEIAFEESEAYPEYPGKERLFLKSDSYILTQEQTSFLFVQNWEYFHSVKGISSRHDKKSLLGIGKPHFFIYCQNGKLDIRSGEFKPNNYKDSHKIPCCRLSKDEFFHELDTGAYKLLKKENESRPEITEHNSIIEIINKYYALHEKNSAEKISNKQITEILENYQECTRQLVKLCHIRQEMLSQMFEKYIENTPSLDSLRTQIVLYSVLNADTFRTALPSFPFREIERNGRGCWELFNDSKMNYLPQVKLEGSYTARNPVSAYQENGIVGIDFGTKSTVVSCINDENKIKLIRVGSLEQKVETERTDYENPTILEFIDIKQFLEDYYNSDTNGRPCTSWETVRNSYTANTARTNAKSNELDRFLNDIKQWCGDTTGTRMLSICDKQGTAVTFPPFQKCNDFKPFSNLGAIDPLEIYAYYLGLVINRNNEIYLNYQLSFPITYNKDVRRKMTESFERGLKKSLPDAVLNNDELMEDFQVQMVRSEPAAYAICALDEYPFKPTADQKEFYSVFDFGGGTTDMNFGIWRLSDQSNRAEQIYDSILEQFNQEGDNHLGGENLLELLAFEIFKANAVILSQQNQDAVYCFTIPAECKSFPGSERLIQNDSRSARRNTMQLIRELRPLWEGLQSYVPSEVNFSETRTDRILKGYRLKNNVNIDFLNSGSIDIILEDENGKEKNVKIYIDNEEKRIFVDLIGILEKRIERGIISYFHALNTALRDKRAKEISVVRLLLAGNSCKSPIVDKLFTKYIEMWNNANNPLRIELYHPLGMKKYADEVRHDAESRSDKADRPTGKTGVAYGLIKRSIFVYEEMNATDEAKFKFYLGRIREKNFKVVIRRDEEYGKWIYFGYPASGNFDLFYTHLPDAVSGELSEKYVKRAVCRVRTPDRDKDIYVRLVTPDTIEYGIGDISDVPEGAVMPDDFQVESLDTVRLIP